MNSSSSIHFFIFAVVLVFLRCPYATGAATCHPDDEAGLLAFKSGLTDPSGILSSWKRGTDCCSSWNFVSCQGDGRIPTLHINGKSDDGQSFLSGTISPSLAKLQRLQQLTLLDFKNITGSIPASLFEMPELSYLSISNCGLSGPLPTNISRQSPLRQFGVRDNFFTGTIPLQFANFKHLATLDLSGNLLSGTIPSIFKSTIELQEINLSRNNFYGKFPHFIASLHPLEWLSVLDISWNRFSGTVPKSISNFTRLNSIDLSHNLLTGPFHVLKDIVSLDLSYNKFNLKTIPKWIDLTMIINSLKLAKCGIKMNIDDWNSTALYYYIDLSENQIFGSPTRFLKKKKRLTGFLASGNQLRFDIGKLNISGSLQELDLSRNLVFGKVPAAVAGLQKLNLSQNHLCGKLPVTNFPASAFLGNDCLCGAPLAPCKL